MRNPSYRVHCHVERVPKLICTFDRQHAPHRLLHGVHAKNNGGGLTISLAQVNSEHDNAGLDVADSGHMREGRRLVAGAPHRVPASANHEITRLDQTRSSSAESSKDTVYMGLAPSSEGRDQGPWSV